MCKFAQPLVAAEKLSLLSQKKQQQQQLIPSEIEVEIGVYERIYRRKKKYRMKGVGVTNSPLTQPQMGLSKLNPPPTRGWGAG